MIEVERRAVLAAAMLAGVSTAGDACSLVATVRPRAFDDAACRRSLNALVAAIRAAGRLDEAGRQALAESLGVDVDDSVSDPILDYRRDRPIELADVLGGWSRVGDQPDRTPIRLKDVNLLKSGKGAALYQFTLERDQYHPEDQEGCNGIGAHEAFFGPARVSYLGEFLNNQLRSVRGFDEWLRVI